MHSWETRIKRARIVRVLDARLACDDHTSWVSGTRHDSSKESCQMSANQDVRRIAIVGTGVIGASWAAYYLSRGFEVVATNPGPQARRTCASTSTMRGVSASS